MFYYGWCLLCPAPLTGRLYRQQNNAKDATAIITFTYYPQSLDLRSGRADPALRGLAKPLDESAEIGRPTQRTQTSVNEAERLSCCAHHFPCLSKAIQAGCKVESHA